MQAFAWDYSWRDVGTARGRVARSPRSARRAFLRTNDQIVNTVSGMDGVVGAPPGQGPSSSSSFAHKEVPGMIYADVPQRYSSGSRGSSGASSAASGSRSTGGGAGGGFRAAPTTTSTMPTGMQGSQQQTRVPRV